MRIYCLTEVGRIAAKKAIDESEESKVLRFIRENKTATDAELEVIGGRHAVRKLQERSLIKELTT